MPPPRAIRTSSCPQFSLPAIRLAVLTGHPNQLVVEAPEPLFRHINVLKSVFLNIAVVHGLWVSEEVPGPHRCLEGCPPSISKGNLERLTKCLLGRTTDGP